jgi:ribosomal protein S18 acetylase RimI-like enzyme
MNDMCLHRVPSGPERKRCVELLLLADASEQQVRSYIDRGELFAYKDGDKVIAIVLVIPESPLTVELKAVAVDPLWQSRGLGQQLLRAVLDVLRSRGVRQVVVGTANTSIGPLAFYQKVGFRFLRIERDYFSEARGYPPDLREDGITVRDMIWMDQWLHAPADPAPYE